MNLAATLLTVAGIGFMIFIHELGHYLAARAAGVRVLVFSLGFGPRLLGIVRNGTDYRVSLVPVGGYVLVAGADNFDRRRMTRDEINAKGFGARLFYYSGGVLMNVAFALVAFPLVFHHGVPFTAPVIGQVVPGSAAWHADLRPGDRIVRVAGKELYAFENLHVEVALAGAAPVELVVERDGAVLRKQVLSEYDSGEGLRRIGIGPMVEDAPATLAVRTGSPAWQAGLRSGDRLLAIDGQPARGEAVSDLLFALTHRPPGVEVAIEHERPGEGPRTTRFTPPAERGVPRIGVTPVRSRVVAVRATAPPAIAALGLQPGDEVASIDGRPFLADSLQPWREGPAELTVVVRRGSPPAPVTLRGTLSAAERASLSEHVVLGADATEGGAHILVKPGDPAHAAGLRDGDRIVELDGRPVAGWSTLVEAVRAARAERIACRALRDGQTLTAEIAPASTLDLGFDASLAYRRETHRVDGVGAAIQAGFVCSLDLVKQLYVTLKEMLTGDVSARNLGGIIQISRVTYAYAESGFARFIYFLALLSINLAFINVLPIPVLDGGHLLFLLIERIKGSPVSARVHGYSLTLGLVFVVGLMVFVTYNDILRLF